MINKNIGKLESVIKSAVRASRSIDRGPITNPDINALDRVIFAPTIDSNPGVFIWGIHKWGSNQYRVSK